MMNEERNQTVTGLDLIAKSRRLENDYGDGRKVMLHMSAITDAFEIALQECAERKESEGELVDTVNDIADERDAAVQRAEAAEAEVSRLRAALPSADAQM